MTEAVLDFIERRFKNTDAKWTDGNCYWFSKILTMRFPTLSIYYLPVEGHFVAGDGKSFYDYNGELVASEYKIIPFGEIYQNDPLWYERLMKDCVL